MSRQKNNAEALFNVSPRKREAPSFDAKHSTCHTAWLGKLWLATKETQRDVCLLTTNCHMYSDCATLQVSHDIVNFFFLLLWHLKCLRRKLWWRGQLLWPASKQPTQTRKEHIYECQLLIKMKSSSTHKPRPFSI